MCIAFDNKLLQCLNNILHTEPERKILGKKRMKRSLTPENAGCSNIKITQPTYITKFEFNKRMKKIKEEFERFHHSK